MEFEYEMTLDDVIKFNLHHAENSPAYRRNYWMAWLGPPACWGMIAYWATQRNPFGMLPQTLLFSSVLFAMTILAWILWFPRRCRRTLVRRVEEAYSERTRRTALGKQRLCLTPQGIFEVNGAGEKRTNWMAVERIVPTGEYIFIYLGAFEAAIVPRRAFPSDSAYEEFLHTVRNYHADARA